MVRRVVVARLQIIEACFRIVIVAVNADFPTLSVIYVVTFRSQEVDSQPPAILSLNTSPLPAVLHQGINSPNQ